MTNNMYNVFWVRSNLSKIHIFIWFYKLIWP